MRKKIEKQPINNGEKVRMSYVMATLAYIIGGSSSNTQNDKIDEQVKEIQKSETKGYIDNLEERMLQLYKEGKVKVQKGPKIKKAEIKKQDLDKIKEIQARKRETDKEREER